MRNPGITARGLYNTLTLALLLLASILLFPNHGAALGPDLGGVIAVEPPTSPADEAVTSSLAAAPTSNWKVVYVVGEVVGEVDGPSGTITLDYIQDARENTTALRGMGMTVAEFYPPNNRWADIRAAAVDARVIIYAGHGISWGGDPPEVGGFRLRPDEAVSPDQIRNELRMAPGAIAILSHVCFASGTSSGDATGITSEEARRRVAQYSQPFLQAGLIGYYSSWYYGFPAALLTSLASGMTQQAAYEAYHDFDPQSVERYQHPDFPQLALWLDKDDWPDWPGFQYNYAFAGAPALRLTGDFSTPSLILSPQTITLSAIPSGPPQVLAIQVGSTDGATVTWTAGESPDQSWLSIQTVSSPSGQVLLITVTPPSSLGHYTTDISVVTSDRAFAEREVRVSIALDVMRLTLVPFVAN